MGGSSTLKKVGEFVLTHPSWAIRAYVLFGVAKYFSSRGKKKTAIIEASSSANLPNLLLEEQEKKKHKVDVDEAFFKNLWKILKIVIPGVTSKEFMMLVLHTVFLVLRTYLSVVVAQLDGVLVKTLVMADANGFLKGLGMWFGIAIPATFTNSMIKYLQSALSLSFRTRLTNYIHQEYMKSKTYYKVINLDSRIENADQLITTDSARFCDALAELYGNIGKPALDMYLFSRQLRQGIGAKGMGSLWWAYYATALILRAVTPPFGKMRAVEAKLEGDFRYAHSRIIINAEEISFYGGENTEKTIVDSRYLSLIKQTNTILRTRIWFNIFEDMLIKYLWSTIGLLAQAFPVFFPDTSVVKQVVGQIVDDSAERTENYITSKRLMISLADAGGRIMYSYKDLTELAGYTARVTEMLNVFEDMKKANYEKIMTSKEYSLKKLEGKLTENPTSIQMAGVPIITPNGDVLAQDLSFAINQGDHLMITGPNGCGKSSLVRIISELWPIFRGTLQKPKTEELFFVPQRPYLKIGSLRDQVIYPDTVEDMKKKGIQDSDLAEILKAVHLRYIVDREGGWDTIKEWKDVFSGGEKQRIGMARLFYHKPKFAFLDECTSAVSADVEGLMYAHAKDIGISLITVSHRPSLFKYHKFLIKFEGDGSWEFSQLDSNKELLSIGEEINSLKQRLSEVPTMEARLKEVEALLRK